MPDHAAFIATICDRPQDDGPRLVYSDWLEEQGEAERAEFIRLQCAIEKLTPCGADWKRTELECPWCDAKKRERYLWHVLPTWKVFAPYGDALSTNADEPQFWIPDQGGALFVVRRGFVESVALSWPDWLQHAPAIRESQPVTKVRLTTWPEDEVGDQRMPEHLADWLGRAWPGPAFELPPARYGSTMFQTSFNDVQVSLIWGGRYVEEINIFNGRPDAVRVSDIIIGPRTIFQYSDRLTGSMSRMIPRGVLTVESLNGEVILRLTLPEYMRQHPGMPMNAGEPRVESLDVTSYLGGGMRQYAPEVDVRQLLMQELNLDSAMMDEVFSPAVITSTIQRATQELILRSNRPNHDALQPIVNPREAARLAYHLLRQRRDPDYIIPRM